MLNRLKLRQDQQKNKSVFFCLLLIFLADCMVYFAGGAHSGFTQLLYLPIIISAVEFNVAGSTAIAFTAGLSLGPLMPEYTATGIPQRPADWILRTIFFLLAGWLVHFIVQKIKVENELRIKKAYGHVTTGYPNSNKLRIDTNEWIRKSESFSLILFKLANFDQICSYMGRSTEALCIHEIITVIKEHFGNSPIYSIHTNELIVALHETDTETACLKAKEVIKQLKKPVILEGMPVNLALKCGVTSFPLHGSTADELLYQIRITANQADTEAGDICSCKETEKQLSKQKCDLIQALYEAIKNNRFSILYQPKVSLSTNEVIGVEALLRWNDGQNRPIRPSEFIKVAEDAGLISEITKIVIKNAVSQIKKWKEEGTEVKVAINISSNDIRDNSIVDFTKDCLQANQIDALMLEFELTERTIIQNESQAEHLLNEIKALGIKISLDDFGTGYNSLLHLINLPIDYIKIDKLFIDNIYDIHRPLVKNIINLAHDLGKEVIAEGAETEDQIKILRSLNCDSVQGYYFSKPLEPRDIKNFVAGFGPTKIKQC